MGRPLSPLKPFERFLKAILKTLRFLVLSAFKRHFIFFYKAFKVPKALKGPMFFEGLIKTLEAMLAGTFL